MSERPVQQHARSGSILIIVVGLAVLLLTTFVVITRQLRSEAVDGAIIMRDAQARMMLPAALGFILECARLGQHNGEECFGWTDVRDGGIGPRGPIRSDGSLPPEIGGSRWPALGTHYRADMSVWRRPPAAVQLTRAYNPVSAPRSWLQDWEGAEDPSMTLLHRMLEPVANAGTEIGRIAPNASADPKYWNWTEDSWPVLTDRGLQEHWGRAWDEIMKPIDDFEPTVHHALTPQPVSGTFPEFLDGDPTPRRDGGDRAWFRVYRLPPQLYDGNDGDAWFDTVPLSGYGVFIVTCGAGGSRGFQDWAEVTDAGQEDVFLNDRQFFEEVRAAERLLWYRLEWSGFTGGGADANHMYGAYIEGTGGRTDYYTRLLTQTRTFQPDRDNTRPPVANSPIPLINTLGTIRFIERLEREPTDAAGNPLW